MSDTEQSFFDMLSSEQLLLLGIGTVLGILGLISLSLAVWMFRNNSSILAEPGPKRREADRVGWILFGGRSPEL